MQKANKSLEIEVHFDELRQERDRLQDELASAERLLTKLSSGVGFGVGALFFMWLADAIPSSPLSA